jgi:hypothetical protein
MPCYRIARSLAGDLTPSLPAFVSLSPCVRVVGAEPLFGLVTWFV